MLLLSAILLNVFQTRPIHKRMDFVFDRYRARAVMSKLASNVLIRIVTVRRKIHSRIDSADGLEIIYIIT